MKTLLSILTATLLIACNGSHYKEGALWEREGGILNPWGGEFLISDISISRCIRNTRIINERKKQDEINYNEWAKRNGKE